MHLKPFSYERRQFGRRQVVLHGWIKAPGRPRLPCVIRDLSIGGALIEIEVPPCLPYSFILIIEAEGLARHCEVKHQTSRTLGVKFVADPHAEETTVRVLSG